MDYDHNRHVFFFLVLIILNFLESKSSILIILARCVNKLFVTHAKLFPFLYIKLLLQ